MALTYPCEFEQPDGTCGAPAQQAVLVRPRLSDQWQPWPVCDDHAPKIARDIPAFFEVVGPVPIEEPDA